MEGRTGNRWLNLRMQFCAWVSGTHLALQLGGQGVPEGDRVHGGLRVGAGHEGEVLATAQPHGAYATCGFSRPSCVVAEGSECIHIHVHASVHARSGQAIASARVFAYMDA